MDAGLLRRRRSRRLIFAAIVAIGLFVGAPASAQYTQIPLWENSQWWRSCASLDLDFYNDRYYINGNTSCDGTVGTQYSAGGGNTGVQNFINGTGATFTRGGTSNITATGIPFYLQSNESFVSRASTATYFNSGGVLSIASANTARTDYEYNGAAWINEGTLIEPAATNYTYPSVGLNGCGAGFTKTTNYTTAPDGTSTAERLVWSGSANSFCYPVNFSTTSGATYTASVFLEANSTSSIIGVVEGDSCGSGQARYIYNFSTETGTPTSNNGNGLTWSNVSGGAISLGSGWYRLYVTGTVTGTDTCNGFTGGLIVTTNAAGDVDVWGLQTEQNAYPTSYIPTTTAAVTRSADVYSALGGSDDITSTFAPSYLASNQYYFSRASAATYFDSTGTLRYAPFWAGRTNYTYNGSSWINSGTLIEPASTNLQSSSNSFTTFGVTGSVTVTANATTSPDGTNDASVWTRGATGPSYIGNTTAKAGSALTYSTSVYVKLNTATYFAIRSQGTYPSRADVVFDLATGSISTAAFTTSNFSNASASITSVGNGWYRVTLTATTDTATSIISIFSFNSNGALVDQTDSSPSSSGYLFGAQLEQASYATSYIPTGGTTVTRAADQYANPYGATYYNSSGYIASAAPNVPRLDHDPTTVTTCNTNSSCAPKGILIEQSQTNMVPGSQGVFSSSTYWCQNCSSRGVTLADNVTATLSPDGTYDASSMTTTDVGNYGYTNSQALTISTSTPYVVSAYVKYGGFTGGSQISLYVANGGSSDGSGVTINLGSNNGTGCRNLTTGVCLATGSIALPNSWYRIWGAFETTTTTNPNVFLSFSGSEVGTFYMYGVQVEAGSFPTSYIPTSTAAVTRPADVFTLPTTAGPGSGWYNSSSQQGTLLGSGMLAQNMPSGTYPAFADMDDGTISNRVTLYFLGMSSCCNLFGEIHYGGPTIVTAYPAISIGPGTLGRSAWTFGSSDYGYATEGQNVALTQSSSVPNLTLMRVGSAGGTYFLDGWVNRITFFPTPQSAANLVQYTN